MKTNKILGPVLVSLVIIFFTTLSIEYINIKNRIERLERNDQEVKTVLHNTDTFKVVELKSGALSIIQ